jgi:diguanylate cyclase (GGDEF)-like protein
LLEKESGDEISRQRLSQLLEQDGDAFSQLIHLLTHLKYKEGEAKHHWEAIEHHRRSLSGLLDRDAGLQVAALDYFFNLHSRLRNPKVIEIDAFLATERDAFVDRLTGLFNRSYFDTSLRREAIRAQRYGLTFSLVMLDLDNFKMVNDSHGHLVGDEALAFCSEVIRKSVREIDVPCRYGGEEFALILPETSRSGAYIVSERIRSDIESLFERRPVRTCKINLSVSGGVAIFPVDSSSNEGLVSMADRALYRSKREGKNQITLHADEKRRSPRFDAQKPLTFHSPVSAESDELTSQTKNLSRGGALVECAVPLTIGTELELSIKTQQPAENYTLTGKVVRLEEISTGPNKLYGVGIAFLAQSEDEQRNLENLTEELYRPLDEAS